MILTTSMDTRLRIQPTASWASHVGPRRLGERRRHGVHEDFGMEEDLRSPRPGRFKNKDPKMPGVSQIYIYIWYISNLPTWTPEKSTTHVGKYTRKGSWLTETEIEFMGPKYYAFRKWLDTRSENMIGCLGLENYTPENKRVGVPCFFRDSAGNFQ